MAEDLSELRVDLQATVTYINDQIGQQADTFDFDEAAGLLEDLGRVIDTAKLARDLLTQELLRQLEAGDREFDGRRMHRKTKSVERYDHDYLAVGVHLIALNRAANHDTGETSAAKAAEEAVGMMRDLYLNPSTKAKIGVIERLGLDKRKARTYVATGDYELEILE